LKKKTEDVLGEDQFGFRRGQGTRDTTGMLRIISERTLDVDEELWLASYTGRRHLSKLGQINAGPKGTWYQLA
jgi:hypothetical protein